MRRSAFEGRRGLTRVTFLLGFGPLGCQLVFGDFRVDTSGLYPDPGDTACNFGEFRCVGGALKACAADRSSMVPLIECESPDRCNLNAGACRACTEGERQCNGATLEVCTAGKWQRTACASAKLCAPQGCLSPMCKANEHRCVGDRLERCAPARDRWELLTVCSSAGLCDAQAADAALAAGSAVACQLASCKANQFRCEGAQPQRCNANLDGWENVGQPCSTAGACNPATGRCEACAPNSYACSGKELLKCTSAGQFENADTCAAVELCQATAQSGACLPNECDSAGRVESCFGGIAVRCSEALRLDTLLKCERSPYCTDGQLRCSERACQPNSARCFGNLLLACNGDGTAYSLLRSCEPGTRCDPLTKDCLAGPCPEGALRCNERYLEACEQQTWKLRADCTTAELCRAEGAGATCLPPACGGELPEFGCADSQPQQCSIGRNALETRGSLCTSEERCDPVLGRCIPS